MPPLPAAGDKNWRDDWATAVHNAAVDVTTGRLTDDALRGAFGSRAAALARPFSPPTAAPVATMIPANYAGHGWTVAGGGVASSELNDTTDYGLGTQSIRIVTGTTAGNAVVDRAGLAVDWTGKDVRLFVKYDDVTKLGTIRVYLYTGGIGSANRYEGLVVDLALFSTARSLREQPGEWLTLDIPFNKLAAVGAPNRAAIDAIRVQFNGKNGQAATVNFGGAAAVQQDPRNRWPNGVLSITFDDNHVGQRDIAVPYLDRFGHRATFFPIIGHTSGSVFPAAYLTTLARQGHEIGSHAANLTTHNNGLLNATDAELVAEFETLRQWQIDNSFQSGAYAYPLGYWNQRIADVAARYFDSGLLAQSFWAGTARPDNPYAIRRIDGSQTQSVILAEMDRAKAAKAWTVLMFHGIVPTSATGNQVTTAQFQALVDYANSLGMAVRTVGEVMATARG